VIVVLLNRNSGVATTTLALHRAGQWSRHGQWATLVDTAPQRPALHWSDWRVRLRFDCRFDIIGLTSDPRHREAREPARYATISFTDHDLPAFAARIGQRVMFADAACLVFEQQSTSVVARKIAAFRRCEIVVDMLCPLPAHEFPDTDGDNT
jgi:hypothetical protein